MATTKFGSTSPSSRQQICCNEASADGNGNLESQQVKSSEDNSVPAKSEKFSSTNPISSGSKRPQMCRYYFARTFKGSTFARRCPFGDKCRFSHEHPSRNPEKPSVTAKSDVQMNLKTASSFAPEEVEKSSNAVPVSKPELFAAKPNVCRYFAQNGRCRYGQYCRFSHIAPPPPNSGLKSTAMAAPEDRPTGSSVAAKNLEIRPNHPYSQYKKSEAENKRRPPPPRHRKYKTEDTVPVGEENLDKNVRSDNLNSNLAQNLSNTCQTDKHKGEITAKEATELPPKTFRRRPKTFASQVPSAAPSIQTGLSETTSETSRPNDSANSSKSSVQGQIGTREAFGPPNPNFCQKRSEISEEKLAQLRQTDIASAKKRFPEFREVGDNKISVDVPATDPDWPFDIKAIEVELFFPQSYPRDQFSAEIVGPGSLPDLLLGHITKSAKVFLDQEHQRQEEQNIVELYLRKFIRWLDRNMETLFVEGLRKVRMDMQAKAAGISVVTFDNRQNDTSPNTEVEGSNITPAEDGVLDKSDESGEEGSWATDSESDSDSDSDSGDIERAESSQGSTSKAQRRGGIQVRLASSRFSETVASIFVSKLTLVLDCERCRTKFESCLSLPAQFRTDAKSSRRYSCVQCHADFSVEFSSSLVHESDHLLGHLWTDGCLPVDFVLLTSEFNATCLGCNKDTQLKGLAYGTPLKTWCRECNTKLEVQIEAIRFLGAGGGTAFSKMAIGHSEVPLRMKKAIKDPRIQEAMPLPDNGACKHYKKSFRWLRFPCCGKTYPCDVCHEENETHEMKFANRMVCGFCAKEQSYQSSKPCVACGGSVTKTRTSHWEGGKGCRDTITMSRSDRAKYANVNKTVSKHKQQTEEKKKKKKKAAC